MTTLISSRLGLLVLVPALAAPSVAATPVPMSLAPLSDEVLHGCRAGELEKALRGRLPRGKRFRLLPDDEGARASLEILECSRAERQVREVTDTGGPVSGPVGGPTDAGLGPGGDREVRMGTRTERLVALRARLASGERFIEVQSGYKDRTVSQAVDTLRRSIEAALKSRGAWLLGSTP